jgi:hypothetical protein
MAIAVDRAGVRVHTSWNEALQTCTRSLRLLELHLLWERALPGESFSSRCGSGVVMATKTHAVATHRAGPAPRRRAAVGVMAPALQAPPPARSTVAAAARGHGPLHNARAAEAGVVAARGWRVQGADPRAPASGPRRAMAPRAIATPRGELRCSAAATWWCRGPAISAPAARQTPGNGAARRTGAHQTAAAASTGTSSIRTTATSSTVGWAATVASVARPTTDAPAPQAAPAPAARGSIPV